MKFASILTGIAWILLSSPTTAAYQSLHVFGDSLSDSGNAYVLSEGIVPPSPPYAQRFSDGLVAAERLAAGLGVELLPSVAGGTNYAVGGATSGTRNIGYETDDPAPLPETMDNTGISAQVQDFLDSGHSLLPQSSLVTLWGGSNDIFLALAEDTSLEAAVSEAVNNLASAVIALVGAGATDFLIPNMPDLAVTPLGFMQDEDDQAALHAISMAFNDALAQAMDSVEAQLSPLVPGLNLMGFDVAAFQYEVLLDPAAFGFTNVTDPCLSPSNLSGSCDGYMYFDNIHPTAATHALLGQRFLQRVPEPATLALLVTALTAMAVISLRHRRRPAIA